MGMLVAFYFLKKSSWSLVGLSKFILAPVRLRFGLQILMTHGTKKLLNMVAICGTGGFHDEDD